MNRQIFKVCPILGKYHGMSVPFVKSMEEYREFYKQHKEDIDKESVIYSKIYNDRKDIGGNKKIHGIYLHGYNGT